MTDHNEQFEAMTDGLIDTSAVELEEAMRLLSETNDKVFGPLIDETIRVAAIRRLKMLASGFRQEDVSTMFAMLLERTIGIMDESRHQHQFMMTVHTAIDEEEEGGS